MNEFLLNLGIGAVLSALKSAVKNPANKKSLRKAMLKIYTQIGLVFAGDTEFIDSAVNAHDLEK